MNRGTMVIVDGSFQPSPDPSPEGRRGFVRMTPDSNGTLRPPVLSSKPGYTSFQVELRYSQYAKIYGGPRDIIASGLPVSYGRSFTRLADPGNPLASATRFISEFAGCAEAKKVRGRAIALARIRKTISGEVFMFPVEDP